MKFHKAFLFFCFIFLYELSSGRSAKAMKNPFKSKKSKTMPVYYPDEIYTVSFLPKQPGNWHYVVNLAKAMKKNFGYKDYTARMPGSEGDGYEGLTYERVGSHQHLEHFLNNTDLGKHFTLTVRETHKVDRGETSSGQAYH